MSAIDDLRAALAANAWHVEYLGRGRGPRDSWSSGMSGGVERWSCVLKEDGRGSEARVVRGSSSTLDEAIEGALEKLAAHLLATKREPGT